MFLIEKYILNQICRRFFLIFFVLGLLFFAQQSIRVLFQSLDLPNALLASLLLLEIPDLLLLVLPLSFFLSILWTYSTLYEEQELIALLALRWNWWRLYRVAFPLLFSVGLVLIILIQKNPEIQKMKIWMRDPSCVIQQVQWLIPGKIYQLATKNETSFIFGAEAREKNVLKGFFWKDKGGAGLAKEARIFHGVGLSVLALKRGEYYDQKSSGEIEWLSFEASQEPLSFPETTRAFLESKFKSFFSLWHSKHLKDQIELQARLSHPISLVVLLSLAIPMSCLFNRNQAIYLKLGEALVVFFLYLNGLIIAKRCILHQMIPLWMGLWGVHLLFLGFGLYKSFQQGGIKKHLWSLS